MKPATESRLLGVKHDAPVHNEEIMSHCTTQSHREIANLYITLMKVRAMNAARRNIESKHG
jgi:hypothetical protein